MQAKNVPNTVMSVMLFVLALAAVVPVNGISTEPFLAPSLHAEGEFHKSLESSMSFLASTLENVGTKAMHMLIDPEAEGKLTHTREAADQNGTKAMALKGNATNEPKAKSIGVPSNRQQMYFRPVSVTLMCVMSLTIASLIVYTALSISRNVDELSATFHPSTLTQTLTVASRVASFAPMLCMLFVGCRMYILATTEGLGEPPAWVKMCMWGCVAGVGIQFAVVVCLPAFTKQAAIEEATYDMTEGAVVAYQEKQLEAKRKREAGEEEEPDQKPNFVDVTGESTDVHPDLGEIDMKEGAGAMKSVFWVMQISSVLVLYGCITGVVVGLWTFPAQTTKISAAVHCTLYLAKGYFFVCLQLWISRAIPGSAGQVKFTNSALAMTGAMKKSPMFAVLFLACRMRALNLDPPTGMPPFWMQCCFYSIAAFVFVETIVAGVVGGIGVMEKGYYGDYIFKTESKLLHYIEHLSALISCSLVIPVLVGATRMDGADGKPAPLSTTLRCVVWFQCLYFSVMILQAVVTLQETVADKARPKQKKQMLRDTIIGASVSLGLAPLLSVLFVATRMRALQITQQQGAPPGWAQDCMLIAVFATGVQSLCCLVMPIFIGESCTVDDDGNPDYDLEPMIGAYAVAVVKYVALMALHGSVITICVSVYVMTPETAHDGNRFLTDEKQFFKACLYTLILFFVALLFSSAKVVGMAIKLAIEGADQHLLGVDITIKKCALNAFKGYVQINDLVVHQPEDVMVYTRNTQGKLVGTATGEKCDWKYDYVAKVHLILVKINLWRLVKTLGKEFELENLGLTGIFVNVEKPDANIGAKNSNVEYILNFIEALGLLPPPGKAEDPCIEPEKKEEAPKPEKDEADAASSRKVILHKIELGDMGVSVSIQKVKILGEISFQPRIGTMSFEDIQRDIFGGREDLTPGETVSGILRAVVLRIFHEVSHELPKRLAGAAGEMFSLHNIKETLARSWLMLRGQYHEDDSPRSAPAPS